MATPRPDDTRLPNRSRKKEPEMAKQATERSFESVLDTPSTEVTRPRPLPVGTYLCMVKGLPRIDKSTKKGTEYSEYTLQVMEPAQDDNGENLDVDGDDLKLALTKANGDVIALRDRTLRHTLFHTEDALWRLKKWLNDLDIPEEDEDGNVRTIRERMQDVPGKQVFCHVKHVPSEDGESVYANID